MHRTGAAGSITGTQKLFKRVSVVAGVNQGEDKSDLKCWGNTKD